MQATHRNLNDTNVNCTIDRGTLSTMPNKQGIERMGRTGRMALVGLIATLGQTTAPPSATLPVSEPIAAP